MKKEIIIFYPSKTIGGAQLLFIRIANEIAKHSTYKVSILDFNDGFLKSYASSNVTVIEYKENKEYTFKDNVIVISPLSMIESIKKRIFLGYNGRYLFWGIHPENTIDILRGSYRLKKLPLKDTFIKLINIKSYLKLKNLLIEHLTEKSVIFMDEANKNRTFQFYDINQIYNQYVPVPIIIPSFGIDYKRCEKGNIAWIGRLSPDKIYSLLYALEKFNNLDSRTFQIHIIGDGICQHMIINDKYKNLTVIQHGSIANEELTSTLIKNKIGMVFGMGTSMLESSALKLPTLLVDPSYKKIRSNYSPKWLYRTENYTLGSFEHTTDSNFFNCLIDEYLNDTNNNIGRQCFSYVKKNHRIEQVVQKLEYFF